MGKPSEGPYVKGGNGSAVVGGGGGGSRGEGIEDGTGLRPGSNRSDAPHLALGSAIDHPDGYIDHSQGVC